VDVSRQPLAGWLRDWLTEVQGDVKPTTWESYRWGVDKIAPVIGDRRLRDLKPAHVARVKVNLAETGLSATSVAYALKVLSMALGVAVARKQLAENVALAVKRPKVKPRVRYWTGEQLRGFLDSVRGDRLYPLWLLAVTTGARRGEVLGLSWDNINLDTGELTINESVVLVGYATHESSPKNGEGRTISLDPVTVAALRDSRKLQMAERLRWGAAYTENGRVFTEEDGSPIHPDKLSKMFLAHARRAGLPELSLHGLRHTHATLALRAGVNPRVVQERLGHQDVKITLGIYSHVLGGLDEEAARKVASLVVGDLGANR
jgi:integrase